MKQCFKCGKEKPLSEFYRHKQMADGHLNKCKECTKSDSTKHRCENLEKIRAYDRARGSRQSLEYQREYKERYPKKIKAQQKVHRELQKGNLTRKPCEVCRAKKTVAHHDDYDKPLDIRWLCQAHHKQWHAKHGQAKNAV